jgi:hypothetical protein
MTVTTTRPRARWPWILGAIVAVIMVVAVAVGVTAALRQSTAPSPTSTRTIAPTRTDSPNAVPTGCLGGSNRNNAMLLAAQKTAPHTTNGAVDFAAATVRWTLRHPSATVDEANQVAGDIIASDASPQFKDLGTAVSQNQNPFGGAVADGTNFYVTTTPGVYYVDSASRDKVTASIGTGYVINGAVNPQLRTSSTYVLEWQRGAWRIQSAKIAHTTEDLFKIGTPFTEGC